MNGLVVIILFAAATSIACADSPTHAADSGVRVAKKFGLFGFRRGPARNTAGNYRGGSSGYRTSSGAPVYGYGIGTGYSSFNYGGFGYLDPYRFDGFGYDPYRYGSFKAPDLLDDPYFQANSLYPDKYPAYRRQQERLRLKAIPYSNYPEPFPAVAPVPRQPAPAWQSNAPTTSRSAPNFRPDAAPSYAGTPRGDANLQSSAQRLRSHLAKRQDGEVWINYLSPDQIETMIESDDRKGIQKLMTHYDGVVANGELGHIVRAPGFTQTRSLLRQYLSQPASRQPASIPNQPSVSQPASILNSPASNLDSFAPTGTAIENLPAPTPDAK